MPPLRVVLLTGQRHEEALLARWSEVDLDGALWLIPAEHRKGVGRKVIRRYSHDVPLSQQAVKLLRGLKTRTGERERVFHGITQDQRGHRLNPVRRAAGFPIGPSTTFGARPNQASPSLASRMSWHTL